MLNIIWLSHATAKSFGYGGAGFIGSHFVDHLVQEGHEVRILDDFSTGKIENIQSHLNKGNVDLIKCDIRDAKNVKKSVENVDVVVHFAAVTSVPFSIANPSLTFDVNLLGTYNLISACAKQGVDKFVFISSCAVYGDPESLPVKEDQRTNPISPYAESKLIGERYCLGFSQRGLLRSVIFRFFNVYGPRQGFNDYSGVITRFIDRIKKSAAYNLWRWNANKGFR